MNTNVRKWAAIAGLGLGLSVAAAPAQSSSLWSFEDDDIDFILRPNATAPGGYSAVQSGTLSVGDVFFSVFEIPEFTINGADAIPAGQELTGVAAVQLTSIVGTGGAGTVYNFGAFSDFNSVLSANGGPALPTGAAIAMFFNGTSGAGGDIDLDLNRSTNPATNCTSLADCIDQATLGTLLQVDGFGLDPDEFWFATQTLPGGADIATVLGTNNNGLVAGFNLGLSNLFNAITPVGFINAGTGADCGNPGYVADGCVQLSGSGTITGGQGLLNGAIAHSDFDAQKYVPEPTTLALFGAGLLGLCARKRNAYNA